MKALDKKYLNLWQQYRENCDRATPIDLSETENEKAKRIHRLERDYESWFKYYFPNFYLSEAADFQKRASKRIINNPEWFEVRSWSRELAKSTRTMMEVLYLTLTGRKKNVLMVSNSYDNACRLLLPYKAILESNNRIINDYGEQESTGKWEAGEFITRTGVSFRALGAGQSPRGTRNQASRPDVIIIDDIDTDEECRNPQRIRIKMQWIEEALYATRSISNPLLWLVCGNIIAEYCCVTEMAKKADKHEIVNILDKEGNSTWPQKNSLADIKRVLSKQSWAAQQKEYFNNPINEGSVFKEITYDTCPPLSKCDDVVVYADPSTSNKDRAKKNTQASHKCIVIIGSKNGKRYLYKIWLDQVGTKTFVSWLYEAHLFVQSKKVDTYRMFIENNTLQAPFYEQVIQPEIHKMAKEYGFSIPIREDDRRKPDKYFRIEGTLQPLNASGRLIFNASQKEDPHMIRMENQLLGVSEKAIVMDGPDALEGGCWLIQDRESHRGHTYRIGLRTNQKY